MKNSNLFVFIIQFILISSSIQGQERDRKIFKGEDNQKTEILVNDQNNIEKNSTVILTDIGVIANKTAQKQPELILKPLKIELNNPRPFIASHILWKGSSLEASESIISFRTSKDGKTWTKWKKGSFDDHGSDHNEDHDHKEELGKELTSALEYLDTDVKYIQYKLRFSGNKKTTIKEAILYQYSPGDTPEKTKKAIQKISNQASKASCTKPPVISRSQWGAQPPRNGIPSSNVTHLIVHHEAGSNSSNDWAARVRAIQNFHRNTRGWSDIGYNFLIDPNGIIYEGRAGGDNAIGAHFCSRNRNTMGVCMLGNYSNITPKVATQNSLKRLLAWKANKENINPSGISYHYSIGSLKNIAGHRDNGGCSSCPGDGGYSILPDLRIGVQELINNGCSGGGGSNDTQAPATTISATGGNTQTGDFTANFNDTDNIGVTRRFYQVLEKYGNNWYTNRNNGFFNDNFNVFYAGYTTGDGNWTSSNGRLRQANTSSDNTKLSSYLAQNSGLPYLYEFAAKVASSSGPRKFGIHIMADDATQTQRGNSYLIWFSGEDNKVRIYETINNVLNFRAIADVTQDNNWANYKITYSPGFGVIEIFKNNRAILRWTDSSPIRNGSSISLRTNKTVVEFDDLKVYKFRDGTTQTITAGSAVTKDLRRRNGKIKSLVRDAAGNWSSPGNLDVTISSLSRQNLKDDTKLINQNIILYPNPTEGKGTTLRFPATQNENSTISIYDVAGKKVKTITHKNTGAGVTNINIDTYIANLHEGQYFIKVSNSKISGSVNFVKQ